MSDGDLNSKPVAELISVVSSLLAEATEPHLDLDGVMKLVSAHAQRLTGATGAVVEMAEGEFMVYRAATGGLQPHVGLRIPRAGSLSGLTVASNEVAVCEDTEVDGRVDRGACRKVGARSMLLVPLSFSGRVVGVLKVISGQPNAFGPDDTRSLHLLAGVLGVAIRRAEDRERQGEADRLRSESERQLRESDDWFRTLIEGSSDMFGVLTLEGVYTYCSPSVFDQLGYDPSELVGRNAFDFIHHDDVQRIQRELGTVIETPPHRAGMALRFRHKSGSWRECDVRLRIVPAPDGTRQMVVTSRDVTEAHRLQRQMADADRLVALGRVASAMAHEFNNVLMGIQPNAELIKRFRDEEKTRAAAERIEAAVKRGKSITQQVLRFTRSEPPTRRVVRIAEILRAVQQEVSPGLFPGITFTVRQEEDLWVLADATQIEQTLVNLCLNARDAMPRGGTIAIVAEPSSATQYSYGVLPVTSSGFVHISVTDGGTGVPPELLTRIFEPLFTTKKSTGGSGLGLSVAQNIASSHEGALFVESVMGEGTTFHLFLMRAAPTAAAGIVARSQEWPEVKRVLIVEDDDLVAHGLETVLGEWCEAVERVSSGGAASAAAMRFSPDIVLLDYGLPDMHGTAVYRLLRAKNRSLPIVFITGHADGQIVRDEIGTNEVYICHKPFETSDLLEVMRAAVAAKAR